MSAYGLWCTGAYRLTYRAEVRDGVVRPGPPDSEMFGNVRGRSRRQGRPSGVAAAMALRATLDCAAYPWIGWLSGGPSAVAYDCLCTSACTRLCRWTCTPTLGEVDHLFSAWRDEVPQARKPLSIVRSYTAMRLASLIGPRVSELSLANVDDIHWELGQFGKILLRGKGRRGKKKERLVPLINGSRSLLEWWVDGPRWQYDDRVDEPEAPLFPSERRAADGSSLRVDTDTLRLHLKRMVAQHLPSQAGKLTPHTLRHFAASELYRQGMDVVAIQELLGHKWINTTMIYVHVNQTHVEHAWVRAGERGRARFGGAS
jgi:Phage integrase family